MKLKEIVFGAFGIAAIFILTAFISLPVANLGYINIGDAMIMLFASVLESSPLAFLVSGIASCLSDIYLGFPQYAIFTFLIKGFEGLIVSLLARKIKKKLPAYICGALIVIAGYALTDVFLTMQWASAFASIGMNFVQVAVSLMIAMALNKPFASISEKFLQVIR